MRRHVCSPLLYFWLALVLGAGVTFSFAQKNSATFVSGDSLFLVGAALIFAASIMGSARTGKWLSGDGRVLPSRAEWAIGLTGAALFLAPLLRILLMFLGTFIFRQSV